MIQKSIKKLFDEDQRDRFSIIFRKYSDRKRLNLIGKRDKKRIDILQKILRKKPELRGIDYFRAGIIFQHGQNIALIRIARQLAKKSFENGYESGRWLYAAATDRLFMMWGKKQKFGTQFRKKNDQWELHPLQEKTTDQERKKYNVLPLQKIRKVSLSLNGRSSKPYIPKARIGLTERK